MYFLGIYFIWNIYYEFAPVLIVVLSGIMNIFIHSGTSSKYNTVQHSGIGRRLLIVAEKLALKNGLNKVCIIAGVGTRNYYRKWGYELEDGYMVNHLTNVK